MPKPKIFIGSSIEGLDVANAVQDNLDHYAEVTIWNQGIFQLSIPGINSLVKALQQFEYAIFIFYPDDLTSLRGNDVSTVRDNVIFETGLFVGKLGLNRVFFLKPRGEKNLHLPTDLLGVTIGEYDENRADKNFKAATGPFCNQVRQQMSGIDNNPKNTNSKESFGLPEIDNDTDLKLILAYLLDKGWTAISFEKIQENIHPKFTEEHVMKIIERHPQYIRRAKLKNNRPGIILIDQE